MGTWVIVLRPVNNEIVKVNIYKIRNNLEAAQDFSSGPLLDGMCTLITLLPDLLRQTLVNIARERPKAQQTFLEARKE